MKVNKQISNTEYTLTDSDTIVSNTDLKGVITYVNDTFIRISGYSRPVSSRVNQAIGQMDDVTQQNAALVEQAAAAAESLEDQAQNLVITYVSYCK